MATTATRTEYIGIFLVAMATLMFEILLTRIFSVTLWAHLAFVAVSVAMFGMTLGAVLVYLFSAWFTPARARLNLALSSALFGVTAVWSLDFHLRSAIDPAAITSPLSQLALAYGVIAVPFVFSGVAVAIVLTQFPLQISRLYAADLAGAACGCVLLIAVLDLVGGPRTVIAVAAAAMLAALGFLFKTSSGNWRLRWIGGGLIVLVFGATFVLALDRSVRELGYTKGSHETMYHEKWNSYSRIAVDRPTFERPFGWGLSNAFRSAGPLNQLRLNIDASAETVLTKFDGDLEPLEHLKYDVTNIGHYVVKDGRIFVIGAGGGRDVLSALVFSQKQVVAVEMNSAITDAVNKVFGDFTGHLDRHPRVRFVNDEARSYLARTSEPFDMIQISLIDTWAATAAGAFVLSENTLYTSDAWRLFFSRLTDSGVLSVSRWYRRPIPAEMYRVVAMATDTLRRAGIADSRSHLMVISTSRPVGAPVNAPGVATLLMKRTPFTDQEIEAVEKAAAAMNFDIMLEPRPSPDPSFIALANSRTMDRFVAGFSSDLSPPTDDRPFFFKMDSDLLQRLLGYVGVLTLGFIVLPVFAKAEPRVLRDNLALSFAFASIGVGFMLVEIAQMQRLIFLLGHPTFSLSVVLFGLLISSGAGSFASGRPADAPLSSLARRRLGALMLVLVIVGLITPPAVRAFQGSATPIRIAVALLLLVPCGFFMGMPFPIAMRIGAMTRPSLTPWFWAINGATSVTASVLAVLISSTWGISSAWWIGVGCYAVAAVAIIWSARDPKN
jgi:predicted membrane-bound spermidine synthase